MRRPALAALALLALLLAACGAPSYYLLPPPAAVGPRRPPRSAPSSSPTSAVPTYVDALEIASLTGPETVDLSKRSLWADSPRRALTRHLAAALDARLAARVGTEPWPAFDAPGLRIEVIVDRMIGAPGGTLDFTGQYAIVSPTSGTLRALDRFAIAVPVADGGYPALWPPTPAPWTSSPTGSPPASPAAPWRAERAASTRPRQRPPPGGLGHGSSPPARLPPLPAGRPPSERRIHRPALVPKTWFTCRKPPAQARAGQKKGETRWKGCSRSLVCAAAGVSPPVAVGHTAARGGDAPIAHGAGSRGALGGIRAPARAPSERSASSPAEAATRARKIAKVPWPIKRPSTGASPASS